MREGMGLVERSGDRAEITFERSVAASVDRVWQALIRAEDLSAWLAPTEIELRVGGSFRVEFDQDQIVTGEIIELDPPRRLAYTWNIEGEPESVVEWTLTPDGDRTRLHLNHRALPASMGTGYGAGWHAYLDRLEAVATDGELPDWDQLFEEYVPSYQS